MYICSKWMLELQKNKKLKSLKWRWKIGRKKKKRKKKKNINNKNGKSWSEKNQALDMAIDFNVQKIRNGLRSWQKVISLHTKFGFIKWNNVKEHKDAYKFHWRCQMRIVERKESLYYIFPFYFRVLYNRHSAMWSIFSNDFS